MRRYIVTWMQHPQRLLPNGSFDAAQNRSIHEDLRGSTAATSFATPKEAREAVRCAEHWYEENKYGIIAVEVPDA